MQVTDSLNSLFVKWEASLDDYKDKFVCDGIINEVEWGKASPKILFIAKEPNHKEKPEAGDFRTDWRGDKFDYKFARSIAEWSFGLIEGFPEFSAISGNKEGCKFYLQKIAFLNVKKLGAGSVTDDNQLIDFMRREHQIGFVQQEIDIISPDIIILGLSFNTVLTDLVFPGIGEKMKDSGYGIKVAKIGNSKVIDFYHPSSRNTANAAYSLLQNVVNSTVFKAL